MMTMMSGCVAATGQPCIYTLVPGHTLVTLVTRTGLSDPALYTGHCPGTPALARKVVW